MRSARTPALCASVEQRRGSGELAGVVGEGDPRRMEGRVARDGREELGVTGGRVLFQGERVIRERAGNAVAGLMLQ